MQALNDLSRALIESERHAFDVLESFRTKYRIVDQFGRAIPMPDKHGFKIGDTISVKKPMRWSHEL